MTEPEGGSADQIKVQRAKMQGDIERRAREARAKGQHELADRLEAALEEHKRATAKVAST